MSQPCPGSGNVQAIKLVFEPFFGLPRYLFLARCSLQFAG